MKGKIGAIILGIVMVFCLIACIEKIKYEQWNGELPTVTGSSSIISIEP